MMEWSVRTALIQNSFFFIMRKYFNLDEMLSIRVSKLVYTLEAVSSQYCSYCYWSQFCAFIVEVRQTYLSLRKNGKLKFNFLKVML